MNLEQHVHCPTHQHGHTLDLIITRQSDSIIDSSPVPDYMISDHISLLCNLSFVKLPLPVKNTAYRKIKAIDTKLLTSELRVSEMCVNPSHQSSTRWWGVTI